MSDRNIPDVSQIPGVSRRALPAPRSVAPQQQGQNENDAEEMARVEPNPMQRERRASSINDYIKTQREAEQENSDQMTEIVRGNRDPRQGHLPGASSFQNPNEQEEVQEEQPVAPPLPRQQRAAPAVMKSPKVKRQIQELFTLGKIEQEIEIAGFVLQFRTLTADEYTRAWTMASIFPEGVSRDRAVQQFLLAYSIEDINGTPPEMLCNDKALVNAEKQAKRASVYSKMPSELVTAFFNEGFMKVYNESRKLIEDISKEGAANVAGF